MIEYGAFPTQTTTAIRILNSNIIRLYLSLLTDIKMAADAIQAHTRKILLKCSYATNALWKTVYLLNYWYLVSSTMVGSVAFVESCFFINNILRFSRSVTSRSSKWYWSQSNPRNVVIFPFNIYVKYITTFIGMLMISQSVIWLMQVARNVTKKTNH